MDTDWGETKYSEKNPSVSSPTINPEWATLELNPDYCVQTTATNSLSHGKVVSVFSYRICRQQDRIFGFYYQYFG